MVADKQGYVHDVMDDTMYQDIMERYGFRKINENGEKFANMYVFNKMVIGGTI